ncbi:hypothetical protein PHMEG_00020048 [Phytophthora megakarya]|uniref:Peptidase A2 domain-containing protein n=1 Tax=Phytophthora megakarya TaxID=4795 RepID=A0A225VPY7_9STRA|nr:hypothetical protein PHMEG_00020048 [Phytophthora megakarya]
MPSQGTPGQSLHQNPLRRMWRFSQWNIWKAFQSVMTLAKQGNARPERRTQLQDNQQSMKLYQRSDDPIPEISEPESQDPLEVPLKPGQRYGWMENHEHGDMHGLATIHGAVNDSRTRILLDTSASVSIMSLDLARSLKLKLRTHRQIKVSDLGGVTTYITTHARVKITLGWSVVYVLNIWVGNIGEGVDVLLGMNFMHSAGVWLCIREGLVKLPDEETVVMYDNNPKSRGMDLPVCPEESIHLRPGQDAIVRIRYGQSNPQRDLVVGWERQKQGDQGPVFRQILGDFRQSC